MLKDLTLEMCVPSLRCMAAHRMHRKMPNYATCQPRVLGRRIRKTHRRVLGRGYCETYTPACPSCIASLACAERHAPTVLTWVSRTAVCTSSIPWDRLDQILQGTLVTRLLAFVQGRRHIVLEEEAVRAELGDQGAAERARR